MAADTFGTIAIEYVTWDGSEWSGYIQDITRQADISIVGIEVGYIVIDPDFKHVARNPAQQNPERRSNYLDYIANDGSNWRCWIHAHNDGSIEFEHRSSNDLDDSDAARKGAVINFRTWDKTCLEGTLHEFEVPGQGSSPVDITFTPIACV